MRDIVDQLSGPLSRLRDRMFGAVRVHYDNVRVAGQRTEPVVVLEGMWAENTTGQNHFLTDVEVELMEPTEIQSVRTEWRQPGRGVVVPKGANLPAFGRTDGTWDVFLWFGQEFDVAQGDFEGYVRAVGRKGFRALRTPVRGTYGIADK